jgi:predicted nuclease with TOPRIM domain
MRKDVFERRAAEMKARMLAQRSRDEKEPSATSVRKSMTKGGQEDIRTEIQPSETEVETLRERMRELETENLRLRQQLALVANRGTPSSQASTEAIREQRHNFFKYSNIRRY